MTGVTFSAPGKAVLCGEYAVLHGAPAVSMAVDRRAVVGLEATGDDWCTVATPGYQRGCWRFRAGGDGTIEWLDDLPPQGISLVEEAWQICAWDDPHSMAITIDTSEFADAETGTKLGFGSSAAASVALVGALLASRSAGSDTWPVARQVHRALHGGRGSGVDVATSCHGGIIVYTMAEDETPAKVRMPNGLVFRFLWSGQAADTATVIGKLDTDSAPDESWLKLIATAENGARAWAASATVQILEAERNYTKALRQFDRTHGLGIFGAGHGELVGIADSGDVVYKPCGAGGGDIGIAMGTSESDVAAFCGQAERMGFVTLDARVDDRGVSEEST